MTPLEPVTLRGAHVRLEPLTHAHTDALWDVARDPALWTWAVSDVRTRADFERYVGEALAAQAAGTALPFAIVAANGGERSVEAVAGCTRLGNADVGHGRVEIGWTFVGRPWQRTAVNSEAKLLLMRHAFEARGARRVEIRTDARNAVSRAAIARLGAVEEGTLRQHMVREAGDVRDTVTFSVVADEWPDVAARLAERLARACNAPGVPA